MLELFATIRSSELASQIGLDSGERSLPFGLLVSFYRRT